jgi:hypothetical protein
VRIGKGMKLLAMLLATSVAACVVGEDIPTEDDLPPEHSEAALGSKARTAFNFLVSKGLTEIQAAGVVGNLMQESSVRPTAVEYGGGPGRGIAQWSIGGRWNVGTNSVVSFAARRGTDRWALNTQLDFMWHELSVVGGFGLTELKNATTITQAVTAFQNKYANQALRDYGGANAGGGTGGTPDPGTSDPTAVTCFSGTLEREMPEHTCVESKFDGLWYQCAVDGWVDRWSNPNPCVGEFPL